MRILAAHDGLGCGHVRMIQPLRELAKHGHDVDFTKTQDTQTIEKLRNAGDYDVVVGQRFAGYDGLMTWRRARKPMNRLVYETDDDLFSIDMANWAAYTHFGKPLVKEAIEAYCEIADMITVTTETLAQVHRDKGAQNVRVLPNCVPAYVLDMPRSTALRRPRIGWIGGASHGVDVHEAIPGVRRFFSRNDDWDLYLGGTDYRPSFNLQNWDRMMYADWTQINEDERGYYAKIDFEIGLAPVRPTKFSQSKSALKCLEYNARGIPVIASDIAPYREYIRHGHNGFLVKAEHEWAKYLRMLAENKDLREEMGAKGRFEASKHTIENNWQKWLYAYEDLFEEKTR